MIEFVTNPAWSIFYWFTLAGNSPGAGFETKHRSSDGISAAQFHTNPNIRTNNSQKIVSRAEHMLFNFTYNK